MRDKGLVEAHEAVAIVKTGERKPVLEEEIGHQGRGLARYWVGRTRDEGKMAHDTRFHGNVTCVSQAYGILHRDGDRRRGRGMSGNSFDYDLLVIGSGPAGQRAAIQGAKLDKKVAIIERKTVIGGGRANLCTIPSKTLREAALDLCGYRAREFYGASYTVKEHITMQDLLFRTDRVIEHEIDVTRHQLRRNDVELIAATASFVAPDALRLDYVDAATSRTVKAGKTVIAA